MEKVFSGSVHKCWPLKSHIKAITERHKKDENDKEEAINMNQNVKDPRT